jgi:hypothetical protein
LRLCAIAYARRITPVSRGFTTAHKCVTSHKVEARVAARLTLLPEDDGQRAIALAARFRRFAHDHERLPTVLVGLQFISLFLRQTTPSPLSELRNAGRRREQQNGKKMSPFVLRQRDSL